MANKNTYIVANRKGGSGKTATAVNLAAYLSLSHEVLLVDMDPQAHATLSVGINPYALDSTLYHVLTGKQAIGSAIMPTSLPGLKVLPANQGIVAVEEELAGAPDRYLRLLDQLISLLDFDFVILDSSTSIDLLTMNGFVAAARVIVPLQTHYLALNGLAQQMQAIYRITSEVNPGLRLEGIVPTMVGNQTKLARHVLAEVEQNFGEERVLPPIRFDVKVAESPGRGRPLVMHAPHSRAAADYLRLAEVILERSGHAKSEARLDVAPGLRSAY